MDLSSGNVYTYESLTGEDMLSEKAAIIKKFDYLPLDSVLQNKTSIAEKQYQELDNVHGLNKTVLDTKRENLDPVYNNFNFNKFNISDGEFNDLSNDTKYKHLQMFFKKINEFTKVKPRTVETK